MPPKVARPDTKHRLNIDVGYLSPHGMYAGGTPIGKTVRHVQKRWKIIKMMTYGPLPMSKRAAVRPECSRRDDSIDLYCFLYDFLMIYFSKILKYIQANFGELSC